MADPFLDFNLDFAPSSKRVMGEADERKKLIARSLEYNVSFLDDCLRGILPHDLIMVGARTGAGKTALVTLIAKSNALAGKRVHYFALEAEPLEIERRLKFGEILRLLWQDRAVRVGLNYTDWYLGRCNTEFYETKAEEIVAKKYATLTTYYRGREFGMQDIERLFLAIQSETDLIILDHLHYVDTNDDNENRAHKEIVKTIRDVSLGIGIPIIVVAHLRKRERRQVILPDLEDFHGSSDITKIATRAIILAPARGEDVSTIPELANTYMSVVKDRLSGATNTAAVIGYDLQTGQYERTYALGRVDVSGESWARLESNRIPRWAKNEGRRYGGQHETA